jgi:hypothetical protein
VATRPPRLQRAVSKEEFDKYVNEHQFAPLDFDGLRYTHPVQMKGLVWHRPVAAVVDGKFYLIGEDE